MKPSLPPLGQLSRWQSHCPAARVPERGLPSPPPPSCLLLRPGKTGPLLAVQGLAFPEARSRHVIRKKGGGGGSWTLCWLLSSQRDSPAGGPVTEGYPLPPASEERLPCAESGGCCSPPRPAPALPTVIHGTRLSEGPGQGPTSLEPRKKLMVCQVNQASLPPISDFTGYVSGGGHR